MTSRTLRFSLSSAKFPFISTQQPRAVVSPDADSAGRVPRQFFGSDENLDYNTVQPLYMENVIPVAAGWRSVRYEEAVPTPASESTELDEYASAGYAGQLSLRSSDPAGTAQDAATGPAVIAEDENMLVAVNVNGGFYRLARRLPEVYTTAQGGGWQRLIAELNANAGLDQFAVSNVGDVITTAYVSGAQFVCIPGSGIWYAGYARKSTERRFCLLPCVATTDDTRAVSSDYTNSALIANLPVKFADISVVAAANGYLMVGARDQISWALWDGAKFDFEEFANNEVTGSGTRIPEDLQGSVTAIVPVPGGALIFSARNCVAAFYSSANAASPWIFRKVANAGGVRNRNFVTEEDESGAVYAYTTAGLQKITLNGAQDMEPAASDFLSGMRDEVYSPQTQLLTQFSGQAPFYARISLVGLRYLCISYAQNSTGLYTMALVFDTSLRRWGKLRKLHSEVFSLYTRAVQRKLSIASLSGFTVSQLASRQINSFYSEPELEIARGRQMLALVQSDGSIVRVILDDRESDDVTTKGVLILGKFQMNRNRITTLFRVTCEGAANGLNCYVQPSIDGRNVYDTQSYMLVENQGDLRTFGGEATGLNHSIVISGQFHLSSVIVEADTEGTF